MMKIQLRRLQKNDKNFFLLDVEQVGQFRQVSFVSFSSPNLNIYWWEVLHTTRLVGKFAQFQLRGIH